MAVLLKTLKMRLGDEQIECQLNVAEINDNSTSEEVETFCGKDTFTTPAAQVHIGGFQDWTIANSVCEMIDDAYRSDPVTELEYEIKIGEDDPTATPPQTAAYRSGSCKPIAMPSFGGTAGSALAMDITMDCIGLPEKTALAP